MNPIISIVTVTRNRLPYLNILYNSLLRNTKCLNSIEWHIVDNGSIDNTTSFIKHIIISNKISIIPHFNKDNSRNMIARNDGIKAANGIYIAQIDDDVMVLPKWDETMINAIDEKNGIMAVGQEGTYGMSDWSNFFRYDQPGLRPKINEEADFLTGFMWCWVNKPNLLYDEEFNYIHEETAFQLEMKINHGFRFKRIKNVGIHNSQKKWSPEFTKKWDSSMIDLVHNNYLKYKDMLEKKSLLTYGNK